MSLDGLLHLDLKKACGQLSNVTATQKAVQAEMKMTKRSFDIVLACVALVFFVPLYIVITLVIRTTSSGPALYWSDRVGTNNSIFRMPKFRTMRIDTPAVATHLLQYPNQYVTAIGHFLRKTSLDELPQLYSIVKGDMSFVGPRPALFNQDDLISLRTERGIHTLTPGLTGWAQINGRDELTIPAKVSYDEFYKMNQSFLFDIEILIKNFHEGF